MARKKTVREDLTDAVKGSAADGTPAVKPTAYYLEHIAAYDREFEKWETRSKTIIARYRDEDRQHSNNSACKFNILWSNVSTLVPATFSRLPQPDVFRRFRDSDPVGRVASLLLERAEEYEVQHYPDYKTTLRQCVNDRFLGGRGTAWARYEPHFKAAGEALPVDGLEGSEDVDATGEELDYECAPVDYVHWRDFGHSVARTWEEVNLVWRKVYMTRAMCIERFGEEEGRKVPLDSIPQEEKEKQRADTAKQYRALIYEIWDKEKKKAFWFSKSLDKFLDERADPLGLAEFFPCPRPLYATMTNDTLVPVPDFSLYQDQARQLDTLQDRINGFIKALQVKGVYDAAVPELGRIFLEGQNTTLIPVTNWPAFSEKSGIKGSLELVELKPIYEALTASYEAAEVIIGQIYQITGISDIVRGQTDPNETLGAQKMKGQFVGMRLSSMKGDVAQFATELLQLKAQIICAKFSVKTFLMISSAAQLEEVDHQYIEPAIRLLFGERADNPDAEQGPNPMRQFRIEVAADSLVQMDEEQEKQSRMEFLTAAGSYIEKVAESMAVVSPDVSKILVPLLMHMLRFGVTGFKVGKQIEGAFEEATQKLVMLSQQPPPPPQPDPKVQAEQIKAEAEAKKAQTDVQVAQTKGQIAIGVAQQKGQLDAQKQQQDAQFEQQRMNQELGFDQQRRAGELNHDQNMLALDAKRKAMEVKAAKAMPKGRPQ